MQCGPDATKPVHSNVSISVPPWRIEIANPEIRHMDSTNSSTYLYHWYFLRFDLTYYAPPLVLCWLKLDQHSTRVVPVAWSIQFGSSAGVTLWRTLATWNGDDAWKQSARVSCVMRNKQNLQQSSEQLLRRPDVFELAVTWPNWIRWHLYKDTSDYTVTWLKFKNVGNQFQLGISYWSATSPCAN
jgi:hypothetical protein